MNDKLEHDGGPAFPCGPMGDVSTPDGIISHQYPGHPGMTLKQWYAGQALNSMAGAVAFDQITEGLLLNRGIKIEEFELLTARMAFDFAEAMIVEGERRNGQPAPRSVLSSEEWEALKDAIDFIESESPASESDGATAYQRAAWKLCDAVRKMKP